MAARKIAADTPELRAQWGGWTFTDANREKADWHIAKYPAGRQKSAVMPLLDLAQRQVGAETQTQGWLPLPVMEYLAAAGMDELSPDDLVRLPVAPLNQNIGLYERDQLKWIRLVEQRDVIHASQSRQDFRSLVFRHDGSIGALGEATNGCIGVHTHDQ